MGLPRKRTPRGSTRRRVAEWALAVGAILPAVGCQVEYGGMTLPSGRYMHDDVQYFPSGPDFPWANSQAATQRARMRAMGIEPPPANVIPSAMGVQPGVQQGGGRPTNINAFPTPMMPPAGAVPAGPGAGAVPPPAPGMVPGAPGGLPGVVPAPGGGPGVGGPGPAPAPGGGAVPPPGQP